MVYKTQIRVRVVMIVAIVLGILTGIAVAQQKVERPKTNLSNKFINNVAKGNIDRRTVMNILDGLVNRDQTILSYLRQYNRSLITAEMLVEMVWEYRSTQIETADIGSECAAFGNGVYLGCRMAGGSQEFCNEEAGQAWCDCMGGYYLGGGFCLLPTAIQLQLMEILPKLSFEARIELGV